MGALFGIFFQLLGGAAAASFYVPLERVRGWSWESYWIIGGIASWLVVPWIAAWLTVPHFTAIIHSTALDIVLATYVMGVLWGIGGLTYGLAMRYLGLSLGISVTLGLTSICGALIPPIYRNLAHAQGLQFSTMLTTTPGRLTILGAAVSLVGIAVCGKAGMVKDAGLSPQERTRAIPEFNVRLGLIIAVISGILSACFAFGIVIGEPMAHAAVLQGANALFGDNVTFVVILWGGLTTNLAACLWMNTRHRSFSDYVNRETPLLANYGLAALAGLTWFLQFFFYGIGASKFSNNAASWILHMTFIIIIGNVWGLVLKEWKGVAWRAKSIMLLGIIVLFISVAIVGYGDFIK